jgi:hypothetical protein
MRNNPSFTPELVSSCDSAHTAMLTVENSDKILAFVPRSAYKAYNSDKLHFLSVNNMNCFVPLMIYWSKNGTEKTSAAIARKQIIEYYKSLMPQTV